MFYRHTFFHCWESVPEKDETQNGFGFDDGAEKSMKPSLNAASADLQNAIKRWNEFEQWKKMIWKKYQMRLQMENPPKMLVLKPVHSLHSQSVDVWLVSTFIPHKRGTTQIKTQGTKNAKHKTA